MFGRLLGVCFVINVNDDEDDVVVLHDISSL